MASQKQKTSVDEQIDENLKRVYNEAVTDELPDRFLDLIAQLKSKEEADKNGR